MLSSRLASDSQNPIEAYGFPPGDIRATALAVMLDRVANSLECYMDLLSARQRQVASNIANADTPGYKTKDIDFRTEFLSAVNGSVPEPVEVTGLESKTDGNNVSVDREARLLSETALRFSVASNLLRSQIRTLRSAIQEGKSS
jgi:flagellar basal-body rod protein FlgB